jgi:prepilin-type N-terminal cleavage/methylation domain-containing protein
MHAQSGFTMVELMVVTAILSVVAGVAVPNLVTSRAVANERAVLATLRTVATAQAQCQIGCVVDRDGDGRGEALALDQLAGGRNLPDGSRLAPATLPASLGAVDTTGVAQNRGYLLALYLPDASGQALLASTANEALVAPAVCRPGLVVRRVAAGAWPHRHGQLLRQPDRRDPGGEERHLQRPGHRSAGCRRTRRRRPERTARHRARRRRRRRRRLRLAARAVSDRGAAAGAIGRAVPIRRGQRCQRLRTHDSQRPHGCSPPS